MMKVNYTIRPLHLGTIWRKKTNMAHNCGVTEILPFPILAYYLESIDKSRRILVDTGGSAPDGKMWLPYERPKEQDIDMALAAIGVRPEEIDAVILTHLHWDHASNNGLFPSAKFYVQRLEYEQIKDPTITELPGFILPLIRQTQYELLDGDVQVFDGISVVLTPGHTRGHQCVLVDTKTDRHIIGGDLVTLLENWNHDPKIPNGTFYDLEVITASTNKLVRLEGIMLPGHDFEVLKKPVYP
jgi:glyoxylase-like metal-dependent hydrolase (beta-lactamase superfamily II)